MNEKSMGAFLAALRKEKGITQRELAEFLNVSDKTVSHWECDENSPDLSMLPIIAEYFGVTCDELIKGERKQQIYTASQFVSHPHVDRTTHNYRNFKISNILTAAVSVMFVILGVGLKYLLAYFIFTQSANGVAFFVTLAGVFVSLVLTVIFNIIFRNTLNPDSDAFPKYRFAANRISSLNAYFAVFCLSLIPCFMRKHGFIFTAIAVTLILFAELILSKKGVLSTEKAFESKFKESIYLLRRSCAVLCTVLVVLGGGVHFFFSGVYYPSPKNIVFTSAEEFKAYMETPAEKPAEAYLADGVSVTAMATTTLPPTAAPDGNGVASGQQSPVVILPQQESEDDIEEIYNDRGEVILTFRNKNKAVKTFTYNEEEGTYHLITYDETIRVQKMRNFCNTTIDRIMPIYCLAVAVLTLVVYKKKEARLKKELSQPEK